MKLSPSIDHFFNANNIPEWSGEELTLSLQKTASMVVRHGYDSIIQSDMNNKVNRITMGSER
jgi:hypothetical protein